MVPGTVIGEVQNLDSPRIRGDGPDSSQTLPILRTFSPYSRGWSQARALARGGLAILPVFAGMVPT